MKMFIPVCFLFATTVVASSPSSDFLSEASRDFERRSAESAQWLENQVVAQRLQRLENEKAAEIRARQAAEAKHAEWLRRADAALNASWFRMQKDLIRQYPDLKNAKSTMYQLFQHIAQNYRDRENPIMFDSLAPKLIADNAARQVGITPLP
jgi:Skp family chaperone for outer membrane proteins